MASLNIEEKVYFELHKEEILGANARFAIVHSNKVEYFQTRELLYKAYPSLKPRTKSPFGNLPMLIDIGRETGSKEYRRELVSKMENWFIGLERSVEDYRKIISEVKRLLED